VDAILSRHPLGGQVAATVVDMHCEATSEKMAMGHFCDGKASMVVGSHTHVPTSDAQILERGTGFQSDAGMCGDYNSVIGMQKAEPLRRFITGMPKARFEPALGPATLCGLLVETEDATGKAKSIDMIRHGGVLSQSVGVPSE
jgi:2',3'-cyclic-nucleotide 2'-phosphodiesterase